MSHLDTPRLTFAGRFLSDVPTMNNNAESFGSPDPPPPGWNPYGGGTFDLLACKVTGGERAPGEPLGEGDPALGLNVLTGQDQVAAKLVDLDPEWPASSEIWGLTIRLAGPRGDPLLTGRHWAAAFRDLWPRGGFERDFPMMGACFTSVLEDVTYGPAAAAVPLLAELRERSPDRLSIAFTMYGISAQRCTAAFATGELTGCLGPWQPGEPRSFVAGRRLDMGALTPETAFGRSVAVVTGGRLVLDLGNAYPFFDTPGSAHPLAARLDVAVLPDERVRAGDVLAPGAAVTEIGTVALRPKLPPSGIVSLPLTRQAASKPGRWRCSSPRPAGEGAGACCPGRPGTASTSGRTSSSTAWRPAPAPRSPCTPASAARPPRRDHPPPARPRRAVRADRAGLRRDRPRRHGHGDTAGGRPGGPAPPADEGLEGEVQRILAPYARHFPIMGEHLVDLGDLAAVRPWRAAMSLALSRDITDPNHMPVTRDLSEPKRATLLRWLNSLPAAPRGLGRAAPPPDTRAVPPEPKLAVARGLADRALHPSPHPSPQPSRDPSGDDRERRLTPDQRVAGLDGNSEGRRRVHQFRVTFTRLLSALQRCVDGSPGRLDAAMGIMFELKLAGQRLAATPAISGGLPTGRHAGPVFTRADINQ